jgi:hypothetical protein
VIARALLAAVVVLSLAGCSGMFAPDPTETPTATPTATPAAACTTGSVKLAFSDPTALPYELVQSSYTTYDAHGDEDGGGSMGAPSGDTLVDITPVTFLRAVDGSEDDWRATLTTRALASGLVKDGFGNIDYITDSSPFSVDKPHKGTYVRGVVAPREGVEFRATCPDGTVFSGTMTSFVSSESAEILIRCEDSAKHDDEKTAAVRAACEYATQG